jgi:hypothetical protein
LRSRWCNQNGACLIFRTHDMVWLPNGGPIDDTSSGCAINQIYETAPRAYEIEYNCAGKNVHEGFALKDPSTLILRYWEKVPRGRWATLTYKRVKADQLSIEFIGKWCFAGETPEDQITHQTWVRAADSCKQPMTIDRSTMYDKNLGKCRMVQGIMTKIDRGITNVTPVYDVVYECDELTIPWKMQVDKKKDHLRIQAPNCDRVQCE